MTTRDEIIAIVENPVQQVDPAVSAQILDELAPLDEVGLVEMMQCCVVTLALRACGHTPSHELMSQAVDDIAAAFLRSVRTPAPHCDCPTCVRRRNDRPSV